jgi:hypothetical protein
MRGRRRRDGSATNNNNKKKDKHTQYECRLEVRESRKRLQRQRK